jgi:tRNA(His) 5'-end guanylyltransferase
MDRPQHTELALHIAASTGLPSSTASRVVADVVAYFSETTDEFVRRRHVEMQRRGLKNTRIWSAIADELAGRPVGAPELSERQLRRIVYG